MIVEELNRSVFYAINMYVGRSAIVDHIAVIIAEYLPLLFILWLIFLWFVKAGAYKNIVLLAGYSSAIGVLFNFLITIFYFHPRPFMINIGTLLVPHVSETSFPSDHTTFMLSIAIMLIYFNGTRKSAVVLSLLGVLGGVARVFCGIHFPADIIGSFIVALFSSFFVYKSRNKLNKFNERVIKLINKVMRA